METCKQLLAAAYQACMPGAIVTFSCLQDMYGHRRISEVEVCLVNLYVTSP